MKEKKKLESLLKLFEETCPSIAKEFDYADFASLTPDQRIEKIPKEFCEAI